MKKEKGRKNLKKFFNHFFKRKRVEKEKKSKRKTLAELPYTIYVLRMGKGRKILKNFIEFLE